MVVMEKGTADAYQDKVMRASQGSVFHIPIVTTELNKFIEQFDGSSIWYSLRKCCVL